MLFRLVQQKIDSSTAMLTQKGTAVLEDMRSAGTEKQLVSGFHELPYAVSMPSPVPNVVALIRLRYRCLTYEVQVYVGHVLAKLGRSGTRSRAIASASDRCCPIAGKAARASAMARQISVCVAEDRERSARHRRADRRD